MVAMELLVYLACLVRKATAAVPVQPVHPVLKARKETLAIQVCLDLKAKEACLESLEFLETGVTTACLDLLVKLDHLESLERTASPVCPVRKENQPTSFFDLARQDIQARKVNPASLAPLVKAACKERTASLELLVCLDLLDKRVNLVCLD